jgi:GAF domain-containing protein
VGAFARLAVELHEAPDVDETVEAVVQFALQAENCAYAGVALRSRGGQVKIGAVTDPIVEKFYTNQIVDQHGPMWESLQSGTTTYIPNVTAERRWPVWQALVAGAGIRSILHVPMKAGGETIGVLSLYTRHPDAFSVDDEAIAWANNEVRQRSLRTSSSCGRAVLLGLAGPQRPTHR